MDRSHFLFALKGAVWLDDGEAMLGIICDQQPSARGGVLSGEGGARGNREEKAEFGDSHPPYCEEEDRNAAKFASLAKIRKCPKIEILQAELVPSDRNLLFRGGEGRGIGVGKGPALVVSKDWELGEIDAHISHLAVDAIPCCCPRCARS